MRHQPRLLRLDDAAELTGRSLDDLRRWCATGRLHCERLDAEWLVPERELPVASMIASQPAARHPSGHSVMAIAFADFAHGRRALDEIRRRCSTLALGLELGRLSLDGREYALVAGTFANEIVPGLEAIVRRCGGVVVDDVDAAWVGGRPRAA